jgi:hypothetical protein
MGTGCPWIGARVVVPVPIRVRRRTPRVGPPQSPRRYRENTIAARGPGPPQTIERRFQIPRTASDSFFFCGLSKVSIFFKTGCT